LFCDGRIFKWAKAVDLKKKQGLRDYALLHLLHNSGARASKVATPNLDYFDSQQKTLAILGKANRYRQIKLQPKPLSSSNSTSKNTALSQSRCIDIGSLSINGEKNLPSMVFIPYSVKLYFGLVSV